MKFFIKNPLLLIIVLSSLKVRGQSIEILTKSNITKLTYSNHFDLIESPIDTNNYQFVAIIKAQGKNKKATIENLYSKIWEQANELGANCFKVLSFDRTEMNNEATLILNCYYANDVVLNINNTYHEKNVVYVFGREIDGRIISVIINDKYFTIKPGTYLKYALEEEKTTMIYKGGLVSAAESIKWEEDKQPIFYTLTGLGLTSTKKESIFINEPDIYNVARTIDRIRDINLGLILAHLLKRIDQQYQE